MQNFIFGEGTDWTYEGLQARRRMAERLAQANSSAPRNLGEGLSALGRALTYRRTTRKADEQEARLQGEFDQQFQSLFGGGMTPTMSTSGAPAPSAPQGFDDEGLGFPSSLVQSESGGNWGALNNEQGAGGVGHGGRLQFGHARLQDAANAGVIPGMTPQDFAQQPPEVQMAVENWHFGDIDSQAQQMGLDRYIGQNVNGIPITQDAIRSMAHLGGIDGARRFLETGGQYNPSDSFGTSLADYAQMHGGASGATMSTSSAPAPQGDMSRALQIAQVMNNPMASQGQQAILAGLLQQAMPQQMSPMEQVQYQLAQAQLAEFGQPDPVALNDQLVNPQTGEVIGDYRDPAAPDVPDDPTSVREYQFYEQQEMNAGRTPLSYADWSVLDEQAANPSAGPAGQNYSQPVTPAQEAVDKAFAEEYVRWTQGGGADLSSQISQLEGVATQLDAIASGESGANLTGAGVGAQPDWMRRATNPDSLAARQNVEEVVQRNLRLILGAQFTQSEGDRLIARAYDDGLSEAENARRLRRLIASMRAGADARQSQMQYYEQNGTLTGWQGQVPTVADFEAAIEGEAGGQAAAEADAPTAGAAIPPVPKVPEGGYDGITQERLEAVWPALSEEARQTFIERFGNGE